MATPIGNLGDISDRARDVLGEVSLIAAEDTRHSVNLLRHLGLSTPMISCHDHNEPERIEGLIERLNSGQDVALICDAGTPLISDPGYRLVSAARKAGIPVSPVPGPCAAIAAMSVSGLPCDRFLFEGFLPAKREARRKRLIALAAETATVICYESGQRIIDCLEDLTSVVGEQRQLVIARELTKQFETVLAGTAPALLDQMQADSNQQRGEFVLLIEGASESGIDLDTRTLLAELIRELPTSRAAKLAARLTGENRQALYQLAESLKGEGSLKDEGN